MSDVAIGNIVGFESARTSRWKHGQIAVSDAARLLSLAQALDVDITVLSQVAAGYQTAEEGLAILSDEKKMVRFLGEELLLPSDGQELILTTGSGVQSRIARKGPGLYDRSSKRVSKSANPQGQARTVILVDDDETTVNVFGNLTGADTGVNGIVARSGPNALVMAGQMRPDLVIFDLFIGQIDGFAAVRSLTTNDATRGRTTVVAASLSLTTDVVRAATGSGAAEVLKRPLRPRTLTRLLRRVRNY